MFLKNIGEQQQSLCHRERSSIISFFSSFFRDFSLFQTRMGVMYFVLNILLMAND
jgi:hypothetical protein